MENDAGSARSKSSSGIFWSIVGAAGQQVSALVIFVVLARLLNPSDFGLLALSAVFVDILSVLSRCGVTELIMRHEHLDEIKKSTAFWLSAMIGLFFTFLILVAAPTLQILFSVSGLSDILRYMAPIAFLTAIGSVHEGLLRRDFLYRAIAVRGFFSNVVAGAIAVVFALTGFGVISLVIQRLLSVILSSYIMYRYRPWRPSLSFSWEEARSLLNHGLPFAGANILAMSNQRIIDIFVGYSLGPTSLGYLRIAWKMLDMLLELLIRPITQVSLSIFTRLGGDRKKIGEAYSEITDLTALIAFPGFIGLGLIAPQLVVLVFGPNWDQSILPMQISSLMIFCLPIIYFKSNALFAVGQSKIVFYLNVFEFTLSLIVSAVAVRYGLLGASIGNVMRFFIVTPVISFVLGKYIDCGMRENIKGMLPALHGTAWMAIVSLLLNLRISEDMPSALFIVTNILVSALVYVSVVVMFHKKHISSVIQASGLGENRMARRFMSFLA